MCICLCIYNFVLNVVHPTSHQTTGWICLKLAQIIGHLVKMILKKEIFHVVHMTELLVLVYSCDKCQFIGSLVIKGQDQLGFFSVTGFEFLQLMIYLDFNDQQKYHLQNAYPNDVSCILENLLPCFNLYWYFVRLSRAIAQFYLLTCESGPWLNNTCTMLVKHPS